MPNKLTDEKVFTVAEFIALLNEFFKAKAARITGEISDLKRAASGHMYFTIKDKEDGGVLDCILWKRTYDMCGVSLEVGMEVILSGHPNIYAPTGRFSFVADAVELVGEGALKKAYDTLKKKLEAEGVFDPAKKRALPEYVQKIGVITSLKGAVIHDFENNLGKYGFKVSVCDSRVEGQQAVAPLLSAIEAMRKEDIEVLVIIRGGGSLESLQAFNNEMLVRAVRNFPVPVIAGIGHDKDVPLAALAADAMVSTPTAAANLLSRPWQEAYAKLYQAGHLYVRIEESIRRIGADLAASRSAVLDHAEGMIARANERLDFAERAVKLHDPVRQLKFGYSIAWKNGTIVKSTRDVKPGEKLELEVADGKIKSRVEGNNTLL